jgi:hypothetical protein
MAKLAITRPAAGASDIGASIAARAWPLVRAAAVPAAIVLLALLLRVCRLELQAWTPDTYEQLTAGRRLVAGEFPISGFYPPGVAITLAPAFLFFPQTLATLQGVIIGSSLVLVVVAYFTMRSATKNRSAPVLFALGVALAPQIVYFSRDGLFDVINTAWIVSAILVVPWLRGRSLLVFAAYGALLAVAMNIRATNPAFLPALVIYWTDIGRVGFDRRAIRSALACRPVAVAGAAMVASYALLAYAGGSLGHAASHPPVTFEHAGENTAFYALAELGDVLSAPLILVLAVLGSIYLEPQPLVAVRQHLHADDLPAGARAAAVREQSLHAAIACVRAAACGARARRRHQHDGAPAGAGAPYLAGDSSQCRPAARLVLRRSRCVYGLALAQARCPERRGGLPPATSVDRDSAGRHPARERRHPRRPRQQRSHRVSGPDRPFAHHRQRSG